MYSPRSLLDADHSSFSLSRSLSSSTKSSTPLKPRVVNYSSAVHPLTVLCRFAGLAPYSTDSSSSSSSPAGRWNIFGLIANAIWITLIVPTFGFGARFLQRAMRDPKNCGVFGNLTAAIVVMIASGAQCVSFLLLASVFGSKKSRVMKRLDDVLVVVATSRKTTVVVLISLVICISILIGGVSFTVYFNYKIDIARLIHMLAKPGTFAYTFYLTEVYLCIPMITYSWLSVSLVTAVYLITVHSIGRQFEYLRARLRDAVVLAQFDHVRRRHAQLLRCMTDVDDVLSYFVLVNTACTASMICIALNSNLELNEITALHFASFLISLIVQCVSLFFILTSASWLLEKASSLKLDILDQCNHPKELDDCIARWIRTVEFYPCGLTIGKIFRIDRNAMLTMISLMGSGVLLWKQFKSSEPCQANPNGVDPYIMLMNMTIRR